MRQRGTFGNKISEAMRPEPREWSAGAPDARAWVRRLRAEARGDATQRGPNALALAASVLGDAVMQPPRVVSIPVETSDGPAPENDWLLVRIADAAHDALGDDLPAETRETLARIGGYWSRIGRTEGQWPGTLSAARTACDEFAAPAIARSLYFGYEPGLRTARDAGRVLDLATLVAPDAAPAPAGPDTLFAIALKAAFFEAVLNDAGRMRGGTELPLVGYVADEAHRFITSDPIHGEQSYLDTCRSFGAFCVLACQSVSSLAHALARTGGNHVQNEAAIEVLWNNAASKLVFRTTDERTATLLDALSPHRPGLASVVRVRPPATLAPGEAYAVLADGRFERRQLQPFAESAPQPMRSVSKRTRRRHRRRANPRGAAR